MALSQKHPGLMIVPWFNRQEWHHVYQLLRNNTDGSHLKQAQEILQTWKTRTPNLPSGVEGTLMLLNVLLIDDITMPTFILRSAYGMILVRFLNLCCSSGDKQGTFSESVKSHNIPEWIVNTRHDLAHKHNMPKVTKLKEALQFCFDWVIKTYWEKQDETLTSHYSISCTTVKNLQIAIDLYCQINSVNYDQRGTLAVKTLEEALKNKLENFAKSVNLKLITSIGGILRQLLRFIRDNHNVVQSDQLKGILSHTMLSGNFFSVRREDRFNCESDDNEKLPLDYIEAWDPLIELIFDLGLLVHFLKELLDVINCSLHEPSVRKMSSLWIFHILQRLLLTQTQLDSTVALRKGIYLKRYPMLADVCLFPNCTKDDDVFEEVKKLRLATVDNPNKYNLTFLSCLLHVCKYPDAYIRESVALMDIVCNPVMGDVDLSYVLQVAPTSDAIKHVEPIGQVNTDVEEMEVEDGKSYRFELVKDGSIFRGCPLGVLVFQGREKDPWMNHEFKL